MRSHHALLLALVALLSVSCSKPAPVDPNAGYEAPKANSRGQVGGLGSDTDDNPTGMKARGEGVLSQDSYLLIKQKHMKNYIRAILNPNPEQGDTDTWDARLEEGQMPELKKGTRVVITRGRTNAYVEDGIKGTFQRIEVLTGEHAGERGSIPDEHLNRDG